MLTKPEQFNKDLADWIATFKSRPSANFARLNSFTLRRCSALVWRINTSPMHSVEQCPLVDDDIGVINAEDKDFLFVDKHLKKVSEVVDY